MTGQGETVLAPAPHWQPSSPSASGPVLQGKLFRKTQYEFSPVIVVIREHGLGRLIPSQSYSGTFTTGALLLLCILEYES